MNEVPAGSDGQAQQTACTVSVIFAFRIGSAIDLTGVERLNIGTTEVPTFKDPLRTPPYLTLPPAVVFEIKADRIAAPAEDVSVERNIDVTVFKAGAVSIRYEIRFSGDLLKLAALSQKLQSSDLLKTDARRRAEAIMKTLGPAVSDPHLETDCEDYFLFDMAFDQKAENSASGQEFLEANRMQIACMLRGEKAELAENEIDEALAGQIAYFKEDLVVIAWNGALLCGKASKDEALVLEFANVQLLMVRLLHGRLENAVSQTRSLLEQSGKLTISRNMRALRIFLDRVMRLQLDASFAVDAVTNEFELVGDHYLARLYRVAVDTFAMGAWEAQIREKAAIVESAYGKLSNLYQGDLGHRLEWIVIILIVVEVLMGFYEIGFRH